MVWQVPTNFRRLRLSDPWILLRGCVLTCFQSPCCWTGVVSDKRCEEELLLSSWLFWFRPSQYPNFRRDLAFPYVRFWGEMLRNPHVKWDFDGNSCEESHLLSKRKQEMDGTWNKEGTEKIVVWPDQCPFCLLTLTWFWYICCVPLLMAFLSNIGEAPPLSYDGWLVRVPPGTVVTPTTCIIIRACCDNIAQKG